MPSTNPAVTGMPMAPEAAHPVITATGTKGFLEWMKSDSTMSKVYAAIRPQLAQALIDAPFGATGFAGSKKRSFGCLCCEIGDFSYNCTYAESSCYQDSITASAPSCATQSSSISSSLSSILGNGISSTLTGAAALAANAITQAQLNQASSGAAPLNLGVGTSTTPISSTTLLLLLGAGGLLLFMMAKGK